MLCLLVTSVELDRFHYIIVNSYRINLKFKDLCQKIILVYFLTQNTEHSMNQKRLFLPGRSLNYKSDKSLVFNENVDNFGRYLSSNFLWLNLQNLENDKIASS